jgi:hypothetical protein
MYDRSSNLCCCVMSVYKLTKCVMPVSNHCLGLTAGPNGSRPVPRDDVACLCGTHLPPHAVRCRPPLLLSPATPLLYPATAPRGRKRTGEGRRLTAGGGGRQATPGRQAGGRREEMRRLEMGREEKEKNKKEMVGPTF